MANIIKLTYGLAWTDGPDKLAMSGSLTSEQVGANVIESIQDILVTVTPIDLGSVIPAFIGFRNQDIANTITIYSDDAGTKVVAVLPHGQAVVLPTSVTAFWAKAASATSPLLIIACDA